MTSSETTFNDEELLLWLRVEDTNLTDFAADRIEELIEESGRRLALARSEGVARVEQFERNEALTKERDDYAQKLMQANNTYTEMHLEIERLSDKLAKAVETLKFYAYGHITPPSWQYAHKTLAEIKGETHDTL